MNPNTKYQSPRTKYDTASDDDSLRPATDSLHVGHSPFTQGSAKRLNLIVSAELQQFRCLETGKVGSLAELAVSMEQRAENEKEERSAS